MNNRADDGQSAASSLATVAHQAWESGSRGLLATAEQLAGLGVWSWDRSVDRIVWSDQACRIYGFAPQDAPRTLVALVERLGEAEAAAFSRGVDGAVAGGAAFQVQDQLTGPDGAVREIRVKAAPWRDEAGAVVGLQGIVEDVTDRHRAEAASRDNDRRLRSLNWALTAYVRSTATLLHSADLESVVASVCEAIVEDDSYLLACVALAEPLPSRSLKVVAGAGRAVGYLEGLRLSWSEDVVEGNGPTGRAIRSGGAQIMQDSLVDPTYGPWRDKGRQFGVRSSVTVPFSQGDTVLGVLIVYADRPAAFGPEEMTLFQRLGEELAFSIALEKDRRRLAASQEAQRVAEDAELASRRRLAESESRFREIAERVHDLILRYDAQGVIEYISPSVRQFGFEPEDLIGRSVALFEDADFAARTLKDLKAYANGRPFPEGERNETRARGADGRPVWLEGTASSLRDEHDRFAGVVTVMRDVTERRAIEDELNRKRAVAAAASVAKAEFLANMSHEIRTPLTGVLGFAQLLEALDGLPPQARAYVGKITASGYALLAIVNDVLDFSRLEAGRIALDPQPFDLQPFLDETVGLVLAEATRKGLALRLEPQAGLPTSVRADAGRLRQVLLNLLSNAVKFTESGTVSLAVRRDADKPGRLRFAVTDTGVGIAAGHVGRLFQRFSQIDASSTREFGGTGLGLAICKGLIEMMGGEIGVRSDVGHGSTFWFTIVAPVAAHGPGPGADDAHGSALPPLKVLLVDDVAVNRELVSAMLQPFAVAVTEAGNGLEAVDAAGREPFDLILMDLQMPRMDGLAATQSIRAGAGPNRHTPILALSANVMRPQVEACLKAGMNDHISKPISPGELLGKIAQWTEAQTTQEAV
jgi:PAS domain S-box-containing protein